MTSLGRLLKLQLALPQEAGNATTKRWVGGKAIVGGIGRKPKTCVRKRKRRRLWQDAVRSKGGKNDSSTTKEKSLDKEQRKAAATPPPPKKGGGQRHRDCLAATPAGKWLETLKKKIRALPGEAAMRKVWCGGAPRAP